MRPGSHADGQKHQLSILARMIHRQLRVKPSAWVFAGEQSQIICFQDGYAAQLGQIGRPRQLSYPCMSHSQQFARKICKSICLPNLVIPAQAGIYL